MRIVVVLKKKDFDWGSGLSSKSVHPYLKGGIKIEERHKRETEDSGGHPVGTVINPKFITQSSFLYTPSKRKGRAQDFTDTKNKQAQ